MREVSERPEAIAAGTACLTGTNPEAIVAAVSSLLDDPICYKRMTSRPNPYGDGHAAERIVQFLVSRVSIAVPDRTASLSSGFGCLSATTSPTGKVAGVGETNCGCPGPSQRVPRNRRGRIPKRGHGPVADVTEQPFARLLSGFRQFEAGLSAPKDVSG